MLVLVGSCLRNVYICFAQYLRKFLSIYTYMCIDRYINIYIYRYTSKSIDNKISVTEVTEKKLSRYGVRYTQLIEIQYIIYYVTEVTENMVLKVYSNTKKYSFSEIWRKWGYRRFRHIGGYSDLPL